MKRLRTKRVDDFVCLFLDYVKANGGKLDYNRAAAFTYDNDFNYKTLLGRVYKNKAFGLKYNSKEHCFYVEQPAPKEQPKTLEAIAEKTTRPKTFKDQDELEARVENCEELVECFINDCIKSMEETNEVINQCNDKIKKMQKYEDTVNQLTGKLLFVNESRKPFFDHLVDRVDALEQKQNTNESKNGMLFVLNKDFYESNVKIWDFNTSTQKQLKWLAISQILLAIAFVFARDWENVFQMWKTFFLD